MYTDSQTPTGGPLIKAMDDGDDDMNWGGRENMIWKHKTEATVALMLKNIPSGWLVGSMEKHLRGLDFAYTVQLNTPSWVSHSSLVSTGGGLNWPSHGQFRGAGFLHHF